MRRRGLKSDIRRRLTQVSVGLVLVERSPGLPYPLRCLRGKCRQLRCVRSTA